MGNLSLKEKLLVGLVAVLLIVFILYIVVIKPTSDSIAAADVQLAQYAADETYYNGLKNYNGQLQNQITDLDSEIISLEGTFIPTLNTDSIVNYVQTVFENNNCPYLSDLLVERIPMDSIILSDGGVAPETLECIRVIVTYASTDGYNIPEYNSTPDWHVDGVIQNEEVANAIAQMGSYGQVGYEGFVESVTDLAALNTDAIKINRVYVEDTAQGFMLMTAEIDFYSASFISRVSEADLTAPYVTFSGNTNVDTTGGLIGQPLLVDDINSRWFMTSIQDDTLTLADRPFAAWYSSAITVLTVDQFGEISTLNPEDGTFVHNATLFTPTNIEITPTPEVAATEE